MLLCLQQRSFSFSFKIQQTLRENYMYALEGFILELLSCSQNFLEILLQSVKFLTLSPFIPGKPGTPSSPLAPNGPLPPGRPSLPGSPEIPASPGIPTPGSPLSPLFPSKPGKPAWLKYNCHYKCIWYTIFLKPTKLWWYNEELCLEGMIPPCHGHIKTE